MLEEQDNSQENEEIVSQEQEEISQDQPEQEIAQEEIQEAPPEVEKAKKYGYLTKEQYIAKHGTEEGFKSPEEFNKFGESYNEVKDILKGMKKKLEQRDKEIESFVKYQETIRQKEYARAKAEIESQLRHAKDHGDVEGIEHLIQEKQQLEYVQQQQKLEEAHKQTQSVIQDFIERNSDWYNVNPEMTQRALQIDEELRKGTYRSPVTGRFAPIPQTYQELSRMIEENVKMEFNTISQPAKSYAPKLSVSNSQINKTTQADNSYNFKKLPEEYKHIFTATKRMMEKNGYTYTEKEYIDKLKRDGDI